MRILIRLSIVWLMMSGVAHATICNLADTKVKSEFEWMESLESEFSDDIASFSDEAMALEAIPGIDFSNAAIGGTSSSWMSNTDQILSIGIDAQDMMEIEEAEAVSRLGMTNIKTKVVKQVFKESFKTAMFIADIGILGPWWESVTRSVYDDHQTDLDRAQNFFSIVPAINEAVSWVDYQSHRATTDTIIRQMNQQDYYRYSVSTPDKALLSNSQNTLKHDFETLRSHATENLKRIIDNNILHFDALYIEQVLEKQNKLDVILSHMDYEFFATQLTRLNGIRPAQLSVIGQSLCGIERQNAHAYFATGEGDKATINQSLYQCLASNLPGHLGTLVTFNNDSMTNGLRSLLLRSERAAGQEISNLILDWRTIYINKSIETSTTNARFMRAQQSYKDYSDALYEKARLVALERFASVVYQHPYPLTEEEIESGSFRVDAGYICGGTYCQDYPGKLIQFDERRDPVLRYMQDAPLFDLDIQQYVQRRIQHGWTEQELKYPLEQLWHQWQARLTEQRHYFYRGNPSLDVISAKYPALIEVLSRINPESTTAQAVEYLSQQLDYELSQVAFEKSWDKFGDFIFSALYRLRQQHTDNMLPTMWQRDVFASQPIEEGVLFNAYLNKPHMYFTVNPWSIRLPFYQYHQTPFLFDEVLHMEDGMDMTATISSETEGLFWSRFNHRLAQIAETPEVRWRPVLRIILSDYVRQIAEILALAEQD